MVIFLYLWKYTLRCNRVFSRFSLTPPTNLTVTFGWLQGSTNRTFGILVIAPTWHQHWFLYFLLFILLLLWLVLFLLPFSAILPALLPTWLPGWFFILYDGLFCHHRDCGCAWRLWGGQDGWLGSFCRSVCQRWDVTDCVIVMKLIRINELFHIFGFSTHEYL